MPASCASAGVGYQHITQGKVAALTRSNAGRYAALTALVRSDGMSLPSRVFSGAETAINASHVFSTCRSSGAGSWINSSGASRSQSRWYTKPPPNVSRSSGYAPRCPSRRMISSSSGRAAGMPHTTTCQPGCTRVQVSTSNVA
jgi:hypothetical protein